MTDSIASFVPLSYETVASLSVNTRRDMTLDFIKAGEGARALSMLPLIPFVHRGSWSLEYDRNLAGKVALACPIETFPAFVETLKAAHALGREGSSSLPELDMGDVLVQLCGQLNEARLAEDQPGRSEARDKLQFLLSQADVPLRSAHQLPGYYGHDKKTPPLAFIPSCLASEGYISPSSALFALRSEEPALWTALWSRTEWIQQLDRMIYPSTPLPGSTQTAPRVRGDVDLLSIATAWQEDPEAVGSLFLNRLRQTTPAPGQERPPIDAKIVSFALLPSNQKGYTASRPEVWEILGPRCYSMLLGREGAYAPRVEWDHRRLHSVFERHHQSCPLPGEAAGFIRALYHNTSPKFYDADVLRCLLFSSNPVIRQALTDGYKPDNTPPPGHPHPGPSPASDPYADVIGRSTFSTVLLSAIKSDDAPSLIRVLETVGPEAFVDYPGGLRKGLDYSALMLLAKNASAPLFETALKWAEGHGILDACAEAKAWVMNEGGNRKKGDLLAFCVALADLDKAAALLALRPDFKMTSARDTARAMGSKLHSAKAGRAVSAWETLLFSKTLAIKSAPADPLSAEFDFEAPVPAPRRSRL